MSLSCGPSSETVAEPVKERRVEEPAAPEIGALEIGTLERADDALHALLAAARRELSESPYPPLRQLRCDLDERRLVVAGDVRSYFLKQMAQALLTRLAAGVQVENRVVVSS